MSYHRLSLAYSLSLVVASACSGNYNNPGAGGSGGSGAGARDGGGLDLRYDLTPFDTQVVEGGGPWAQQYSELWYSSGDKLVYVQIDKDDGSVVQMVPSDITGLLVGQNSITMLANGSLLLLRQIGGGSQFYLVKDPPRDGSPASYQLLGDMPDGIMIEALYTDCIGRLYGMDTGSDVGSAAGNRLLLFTGDYLGGDFAYKVVTDLAAASVADIDDMSPGINNTGKITDNPGFAIDTSDVYDFNYQTGTGTLMGKGGTWGIHALGGDLFTDGKSRLYLMDENAQIFEMDAVTHTVSAVLASGPTVTGDKPGHSGLTGPLTDCETGFVIE